MQFLETQVLHWNRAPQHLTLHLHAKSSLTQSAKVHSSHLMHASFICIHPIMVYLHLIHPTHLRRGSWMKWGKIWLLVGSGIWPRPVEDFPMIVINHTAKQVQSLRMDQTGLKVRARQGIRYEPEAVLYICSVFCRRKSCDCIVIRRFSW